MTVLLFAVMCEGVLRRITECVGGVVTVVLLRGKCAPKLLDVLVFVLLSVVK